MRYILPLGLAVLLLGTDPASAQIKRDTSAVTGIERLVSDDMRSLVSRSYPGHASFRAQYERPPGEEPVWSVLFYGFADDTTGMSRAPDVRFQADGQSLTARRVESRVRTLEQSVMEITQAVLAQSAFEQIATADNVTATIGSSQFQFTHPLRGDLRQILERVQEDPQTASNEEQSDGNL